MLFTKPEQCSFLHFSRESPTPSHPAPYLPNMSSPLKFLIISFFPFLLYLYSFYSRISIIDAWRYSHWDSYFPLRILSSFAMRDSDRCLWLHQTRSSPPHSQDFDNDLARLLLAFPSLDLGWRRLVKGQFTPNPRSKGVDYCNLQIDPPARPYLPLCVPIASTITQQPLMLTKLPSPLRHIIYSLALRPFQEARFDIFPTERFPFYAQAIEISGFPDVQLWVQTRDLRPEGFNTSLPLVCKAFLRDVYDWYQQYEQAAYIPHIGLFNPQITLFRLDRGFPNRFNTSLPRLKWLEMEALRWELRNRDWTDFWKHGFCDDIEHFDVRLPYPESHEAGLRYYKDHGIRHGQATFPDVIDGIARITKLKSLSISFHWSRTPVVPRFIEDALPEMFFDIWRCFWEYSSFCHPGRCCSCCSERDLPDILVRVFGQRVPDVNYGTLPFLSGPDGVIHPRWYTDTRLSLFSKNSRWPKKDSGLVTNRGGHVKSLSHVPLDSAKKGLLLESYW